MSSMVRELFLQLQQIGGLAAIPLLLAGIMLAGVGWRIWKVAVVVNFALIGGILGNNICPWEGQGWIFALVCGVIVGMASFPVANYAVSVLGGVIGAAITFTLTTAMTTNAIFIWVAAGIALLVCCALSYLYLRQVIILVTSFEGGVLLLAAAVAILAEAPAMFGFFRRIAVESAIFVPFLLLVPTVIGSLLQMAEVNRRGAGVGQE